MLKKMIGPLAILGAFLLVYVLIQNRSRPTTEEVSTAKTTQLLVTAVSPQAHPMQIAAEGFVEARWQTTLSAQVSGKIVSIDEAFLKGNAFEAGQTLLQIETLDYEVQLARAESNFQAAVANLEEQKMQAERAKSDWNKLNPNRQPTDFNLRIPQLRSAESQRQAASSELVLARENLNRTTIKAPFGGISLSRNVDVGEVVQVGGILGEIINQNVLELNLSVSNEQAAVLTQAEQLTFYRMDAGQQHEIEISGFRLDPFIDSQNRWRTITLELSGDDGLYLPGQFLEIDIEAVSNREMLVIDEAALAFDGRVWFVDENQQAAFFYPELVYQANGQLFLDVDEALTYPLEVVISPPNSLLTGTRIEPESWQPKQVTES